MAAPLEAVGDRSRRRNSRRQVALIVCVLALAYQRVPPPAELVWTTPLIPWVIGVSASFLLASLAGAALARLQRGTRVFMEFARKLPGGFQFNYGTVPDAPPDGPLDDTSGGGPPSDPASDPTSNSPAGSAGAAPAGDGDVPRSS